MNRLTKIETFFNNVTFTADDQLFVGLDVHKKSYHVALYLNDAPSIDFVLPAKKEQISVNVKIFFILTSCIVFSMSHYLDNKTRKIIRKILNFF